MQGSIYRNANAERIYVAAAYKFCQGVYYTTSREAPNLLWSREFSPDDQEVQAFLRRDPTGHPAVWLSDQEEVNNKFLQEVAAGTIEAKCRATKSRVSTQILSSSRALQPRQSAPRAAARVCALCRRVAPSPARRARTSCSPGTSGNPRPRGSASCRRAWMASRTWVASKRSHRTVRLLGLALTWHGLSTN